MHDSNEQGVEFLDPHALGRDGQRGYLHDSNDKRASEVFSVQQHGAIEQDRADHDPAYPLLAVLIPEAVDLGLGIAQRLEGARVIVNQRLRLIRLQQLGARRRAGTAPGIRQGCLIC